MKSKAVVFACLLFVSVVVDIASAVSEGTQEQHQKLAKVENGNSVEESKFRCLHGCCHYSHGDCVKCCGSATEAAKATKQNEVEGEVKTNEITGGGKGGGK